MQLQLIPALDGSSIVIRKIRREENSPARDVDGAQSTTSVPLNQAGASAVRCEREQPTEVNGGQSVVRRNERRCRSPRSKPRSASTSSRGSTLQSPGSTGTLTLIQRLESIDRGMRPLELSTLLGVGKSTLYDWVDAGTIPAYRHRGVIFFDAALIAAWLRRQATQRPPA